MGLFCNSSGAAAICRYDNTTCVSEQRTLRPRSTSSPTTINSSNGELSGRHSYAVGGVGVPALSLGSVPKLYAGWCELCDLDPNVEIGERIGGFGYDRNFTVNALLDCRPSCPNYANGQFLTGISQS